MSLKTLDGKSLYYAFFWGSKEVIKEQDFLNEINVFPVPDGDTGTNLASTMSAIIEKSTIYDSVSKTIKSIAESALIGARGNSGVIFAQFVNGLSISLENKDELTIEDFTHSLKNAVDYSYSAVNEPVEGTMLTVMKDWVNGVNNIFKNADNFLHFFVDSLPFAKNSLKSTPEKLKVLKDNNVVDAGAKGFVSFLKGIINFLENPTYKLQEKIEKDSVFIDQENKDHGHADILNAELTFRYCTEALLEGKNFIVKNIKKDISELGDSIIIANSSTKAKIHIHTDFPSKVFDKLNNYGDIIEQKIDDMKKQKDIVKHRVSKIAIVTDSSADIPQELIDKYQIHVVPIKINFGKSEFLDKLTISPDEFYNKMDKTDIFPKSSQPNIITFDNLYSFLSTYYDSIIAIHLTKKFSGTWSNSKTAGDKISNKKVTVINSKHLSASLGMLVLRAAKMAKEGKAHEEIVDTIKNSRDKTINLVGVESLKYFVKGGRVSPLKGMVARILNLKPIVSVDKEGNSALYGKAFSRKKSLKKIENMVKDFVKQGNLYSYCVVHANDKENAQIFADKLEAITGKKPEYIMEISSVIAMNSGKGCISVGATLE